MMLVVKRALVPLLDDLRGAADAAARSPRRTATRRSWAARCCRTRKPTTFGLKAAGWMVSLDEAADNLHNVRLAYQLGGPVGHARTAEARPRARRAADPLAHPARPRRRARRRARRGVRRDRQGRARRHADAEVRERVGGGSTSMPHKHNPVAAVSALGCALQAPGLVATLLAAMVQEHERAAGAWHSEWAPLNQLLLTTGSAANWLRTCLETLEVHPELGDADTGAAAPSSTAHWRPVDPPPPHLRPRGRAAARPLQLARRDARHVGPAARRAGQAVPPDPLRHARPRRLGHPARAVFARRRRQRRRSNCSTISASSARTSPGCRSAA